MACGILDQPLTQEEVEETGARVAPLFKKLVTGAIVNMYENVKE